MKKQIIDMANNKASELMTLLQRIIDKVNAMDDNMQLLNDNMLEIDEKLMIIMKNGNTKDDKTPARDTD